MNPNNPKRKIHKLDETVVARIAAGEVVHRPASAIKELLENSLDAGSTSIQITLKEGGMKLLQIQDDGSGITMEDLPFVCERHTTSKLKQWEDLKQIETFGFRGEALASISHVAHVTITSYPPSQSCAFRLEYEDGKPKANSKPKPCASKKGTIILVEDLFYNLPTRKKTIKNPNDEYHRAVEVMKQYAINNSHASFSCKKHGEALADLHTPVNSTPSENIKIIYGEVVANVLMPVTAENDALGYKMTGLVSNSTYSGDKRSLILFINKRLVTSRTMKKAIDEVYSTRGPVHFFAYISLQILPQNVDVNIHPSKEEVNFLNEEKILKEISNAIRRVVFPSKDSNSQNSGSKMSDSVNSYSSSSSSLSNSSGHLHNTQPKLDSMDIVNDNLDDFESSEDSSNFRAKFSSSGQSKLTPSGGLSFPSSSVGPSSNKGIFSSSSNSSNTPKAKQAKLERNLFGSSNEDDDDFDPLFSNNNNNSVNNNNINNNNNNGSSSSSGSSSSAKNKRRIVDESEDSESSASVDSVPKGSRNSSSTPAIKKRKKAKKPDLELTSVHNLITFYRTE